MFPRHKKAELIFSKEALKGITIWCFIVALLRYELRAKSQDLSENQPDGLCHGLDIEQSNVICCNTVIHIHIFEWVWVNVRNCVD